VSKDTIRASTIADVINRRRMRAIVGRGYLALLGRVALLALVVWLALTQCFLICQNSGQDMFPAMKDGDLCVIFRTGLMKLVGESFSSGDIVAYRIEGKRHFGRVVAIPGDTLQIDTRGSVTVNGVTESAEILYPTYTRGDLLNIVYVQDGNVYVLGDYRTQTTDSRDYGPIPDAQVEGKVLSILRRRGL
jgi:signal peptidase I